MPLCSDSKEVSVRMMAPFRAHEYCHDVKKKTEASQNSANEKTWGKLQHQILSGVNWGRLKLLHLEILAQQQLNYGVSNSGQ